MSIQKCLGEDLHSRLSGVVIECLDYVDFITRYDGPEVLFYLDPPYFGCETDYGNRYLSAPTLPAWPRNWRASKAAF